MYTLELSQMSFGILFYFCSERGRAKGGKAKGNVGEGRKVSHSWDMMDLLGKRQDLTRSALWEGR